MGFLADIGRSNMFPVAQGVFKDVMEYQQANRRDALDAAVVQERLQESKLREQQVARLKAQQERADRLIPLDEIPTKFESIGQGEFGKAVHGYIGAFAPTQEITTPDGKPMKFVRYGDMEESLKNYETHLKNAPEFAKSMAWGKYTDASNAVAQLQEQASKGKATPAQLEEAKKAQSDALNAYRTILGKDTADKQRLRNVPGVGLVQVDSAGNAEVVMPSESKESLPKKGELRKFEKGDRTITEEWTGTEWKPKSEAPRYKPEGEKSAESKDRQRRTAIHKEVEKIFGISEFLESAKDPELRRNYGEVAAFTDEISRNPVGYGLKADAGEAEIAKKAYDIWTVMTGKKKQPKSSGNKPPISSFGKKE